jgi:hypothetical protein
MIKRGIQLFPALAFMVMMLAACGSEATDSQTGSATPATSDPTKVSATLAEPDALTGPEPTDDEVIDEPIGFISPTGNVACMIDPTWVRCDILDNDWSPPPRPADCDFDYGQGISLRPGSPAEFVCAGDTAFGPDEVLPYGESIAAGVLACDSADSGFTCRDVETGHGFSISRQAYQLF